jgi:hypothetical protein
MRAVEDEAVKRVFPDYGEVDFSPYLALVDDQNPMHRLWSDGHWLKAYLAQGCYWHNCAFCDVTLDYIKNFEPVETEALFRHLLDQAERTGLHGVHLVDEAAPLPSLIRLAELNLEAAEPGKPPLNFWGNIRFERAFSPGRAALLAAGGLLGVSAGIEVATEQGLKRLGKGVTLEDVVRSCAAFKEAGVLTHGYLIYGYWDEDEQEILDSAEILRQLFAAGLLDSAFWHKFVLTRHSRIYAEWRAGRHPGLQVRDAGEAPLEAALPGEAPLGQASRFACNDLAFAGEERFDRYTEALDCLLAAWMAGDTAGPVATAFPGKPPPPTVPPDLILGLLDRYARDREREQKNIPPNGKIIFLGSRPLISQGEQKGALFWRWRLEDRRLRMPPPGRPPNRNGPLGGGLPGDGPHTDAPARKVAALLEKISRPSDYSPARFYTELESILGPGKNGAEGAWKTLRAGGLVCYC